MVHCPHEVVVRVIDRLGLMQDLGDGPRAPVLEQHWQCQECRQHFSITALVNVENPIEAVQHAAAKVGEAAAMIRDWVRGKE